MSDTVLKQVFALFHCYELASGAKLNVLKSHGLLVGSWISWANLPIVLDWSSQSITIMGAILSNTLSDESWNLTGQRSSFLETAQALLSWSGSYHQYIMLKPLGTWALFLLCQVASLPPSTHIFPFIWQQKHEWLSRQSITRHPGQGGLGWLIFLAKSVLCILCGSNAPLSIQTSMYILFPPSLACCFRNTLFSRFYSLLRPSVLSTFCPLSTVL